MSSEWVAQKCPIKKVYVSAKKCYNCYSNILKIKYIRNSKHMLI